jgi:hypothetical protein
VPNVKGLQSSMVERNTTGVASDWQIVFDRQTKGQGGYVGRSGDSQYEVVFTGQDTLYGDYLR